MARRLLVVLAILASTSLGAASEWMEDVPMFSTPQKKPEYFSEPIDLEEYMDFQESLNVAPYLQYMDLQSLDPTNVTQVCFRDVLRFIGNLRPGNMKKYAVKMVDSFGKLESGILLGKFRWLGTYDECVGSSAEKTNKYEGFNGLYCRASIKHPALGKQAFDLGVCLPDTCTDADVVRVLGGFFRSRPDDKLGANITVSSAICQREREWQGGEIVALFIVCVLGTMSLVGTIIDLTRQTRAHMRKREVRKAKLRVVETSGDTTMVVLALKTKSAAKMEPGLSFGGVTEFCSVKTVQDHEEEDKARVQKKGPSFKLRGWKRTVYEVFLCWSWLTNASKLIKPAAKTGSNLAAINGVRTLSIWVVILGHTYYFFGQTLGNLAAFPQIIKRFSFQPIIQAPLSVDTFFFLSGMLVAYSVMRELNKRKGRMAWHLYYFHRIWRLTPAYMFVVMFYTTVFLHMIRGPFMRNLDYAPSQTNCRTMFWTNLLYINNFYPGTMTEQCLGWSWYLANDMQFYVVSPLFLYVLYKNWQMGMALMCVTAGASMTLTGAVAYTEGFTPIDRKDGTVIPMQSQIYVEPWYRIPPYLVGLVSGWLLVRFNGRIRLQKRYVTIGWGLCTIILGGTLYGLYYYYHNNKDMDIALGAFYTGVYRFFWAVAISWIILASLSGYGGPVNRLLGWRIWSVLGRLTYCAYLVHPIVIQFYYLNTRVMFYLNDINLVWLFLGHMMVTYMVAFATSMMVEAPMMGLEKILFRRQPRPPRKPPAEESSPTQESCNGHSQPGGQTTVEMTPTGGQVNTAFEPDEPEKRPRTDSTA